MCTAQLQARGSPHGASSRAPRHQRAAALDRQLPGPSSRHAGRYAWEQLAAAEEVADDYGLGARDSLQDAVEAVIGILGMKVCCSRCWPFCCMDVCSE